MLPWRWEAEGLVRIQLCILTQAELSEHHQQQFLFLGTRPGHLPLGFCPSAGRGAQEGRAAVWLQHGGSGVGPIMDLEWAKSEQRSGNCIGNKC